MPVHDVEEHANPFGSGVLHAPDLQTSYVHGFPSAVHGVSSAVTTSAGQLALEPVHVSCGLQVPFPARQTVPALFRVSEGQSALEPVQFSAMSQAPATARHTVAADRKVSAGHAADVPVQFSS